MDALEPETPSGPRRSVLRTCGSTPGGESQIEGRDGGTTPRAHRAGLHPRIREQQIDGTTVILRGLTRAPGHFANYTTWTVRDGMGS